MKIAQVVCAFPPYRGGMGNVAYHYSLELSKMKHEVVVFTPHYKEREVQFQNFKIRSLVPWLSYGKGAWLPQLFYELRGFDIIHLHYPFLGGTLPVWFLKKYYPKTNTLVLTYHMDLVGQGIMGRYFQWHTKKLMPKIIRLADKVIVTSWDYAKNSNIASIIKESPEKFVAIPLGTELDIFKPGKPNPELLQKYNILLGEKIVLFVAALDREHYFKGLNYLLAAMTKIKSGVKLLVVGRGDLKGVYEAEAARLGIADRVIFAGYVSGPELPKYYNLADVFAMPSIDKSEAFGLVYVEAMACGCPVIAGDLPGVRTVVEDNQTGFLVEPKNVSDLVSKINKILGDDELARSFSQLGLKKVEEQYSWQKIAKQVDQVYRDLKK